MEDTSKGLHQEYCRSCRAPIVWLRHRATNKAAPLDAVPSATGNCVIDAGTGTYTIPPPALRDTYPTRYTNHFATCPQRQAWKKGA